MMTRSLSLILAGALVASLSACASAQFLTYRPGQQYRSLNTDAYEISIQKNGRLDVVLVTGEPVFLNAFPMVWLDGKDKANLLPIDGRWSGRIAVKDPLGEGQGMMIQRRTVEWHLRAYPAKPFLAVQTAYVNTGKRPVAIRALYAWCVGDPKSGALDLGPGTRESVILHHEDGTSDLSQEQAVSHGHVAVVNPAANRTLIAGFLTSGTGQPVFEVTRTPRAKTDAYDYFRAGTVYDPPIVLEPGERLESDVLYIAVAELDAFVGLERYAAAAGLANSISIDTALMRAPWFQTSPVITTALGEPVNSVPVMDTGFEIGPPAKRLGPPRVDYWRAPFLADGMGVVDYMRLAARRYYLSPFLWIHVPPAVAFEAADGLPFDTPPLTDGQRLAYLTAQVMTGGPVVISGTADALSVDELELIERLTPAPGRPARPVDLFASDVPSVWVLPVQARIGEWHVAGVFNWDEHASREFTLVFGAMGMDPSTAYTVFDYWQGGYHGIARGALTVTVPPGSVRLLGFKRHVNRPMLLSVDRHFTQGGHSMTALDWRPESRQLTGTLNADAGRGYTLHVLAPEAYVLQSASADVSAEGEVLRLHLPPGERGPVSWTLQF